MRDTPASSTRPAPSRQWQRYGMAIGACLFTTALTSPLHAWLDPVNTVMLFLLTVVLVATQWGRGPAVLSAFLSVGLFDFFYVPPRLSFAVSDVQYLLTFAVMLAVALIIGHLTIGLRHQAEDARQTAGRARALYTLAARLAGAITVEQVREHANRFAQDQLNASIHLMLPASQSNSGSSTPNNKLTAATPQDEGLSIEVEALALTVYMDQKSLTTHQLDDRGSPQAILPLIGSTRSRGVLILSEQAGSTHNLHAHKPLLEAVATLVATALERLHFVEVAHHTQLDISAERLRNSILSALSHDIRTPLTSLYGLADALNLMQPPLPDKAQEMAAAVRDQAMRMHRMVTNLLDMARLQSGKLSGQVALKREWQPIEEVIGASIQLLGSSLHQHEVKVSLAEGLPLVSIDAVLMERVFGNLLENAAKYAPPHTPIHIDAHLQGHSLCVQVNNEGTGFPPDKLDQVFGLFERGSHESAIPGVGLGLAICQIIVEAHGGTIAASNPIGGGAQVTFTLPLGQAPTIEPEATERGLA